MTRLILSLICVFISVSALAETVYKKTNPDGSVIFTDQQSTDSEEVKIRKPSTYSPPRLPAINLPTKKLSPSLNYELTITKPVNDSVVLNKINVVVSISLQPALNSAYGHKIRYQLGSHSITSQSSSVIFKNVDRGTHSINVSIIDAKDEVISSAASIQFHMKRYFKKPTAPQAPKAP